MQEGELQDIDEITKKIQDKWNPLLSEGARFGDIQKVKQAVQNNADISNYDKNNWTPLVWACANGHLEIVLYLIDCGVLTFYDNQKYYQNNQINVDSLTSGIYKKQNFKSPL